MEKLNVIQNVLHDIKAIQFCYYIRIPLQSPNNKYTYMYYFMDYVSMHRIKILRLNETLFIPYVILYFVVLILYRLFQYNYFFVLTIFGDKNCFFPVQYVFTIMKKIKIVSNNTQKTFFTYFFCMNELFQFWFSAASSFINYL